VKTHRCYVPDITGGRVTLPDYEAHHVRHVLRLGTGADICVFDGRGREWRGRLVDGARREVAVDLGDAVTPVAEPPVAITLVVGILKGDQMSNVVRDATALGVSRIVPCLTAHVAVSPAARRAFTGDRLLRVAASSAAQCGRAVVPRVDEIQSYQALIVEPDAGLRVMCVEPLLGSSDRPRFIGADCPVTATLFVGPEGGWSASEVALARDAGALLLSLGPRTLRAEIAPTVALSVLWASWGWSDQRKAAATQVSSSA